MLTQTKPADQIEKAYAIAKAHASADEAFDEDLMRHWFEAAFDLCAVMIDFVFPPQEIRERIVLRPDGSFRLHHAPSSDVKLYHGATLVAVIGRDLVRSRCDASLCCYCDLMAHYTIGDESCTIPPRFIQAVARVFAYIVENRGDVELDDNVLKKSGAFAWLSPDVTFAL